MFDSSNYTEQTKKCLKKLGITENTVCQCGAGMYKMAFTDTYNMNSIFGLMDGNKLNDFFRGTFQNVTVHLVCENCGNILRSFANLKI